MEAHRHQFEMEDVEHDPRKGGGVNCVVESKESLRKAPQW